MSKTIKYIGRTNDYSGKTLWEIVGNLKNYGVGRLVYKHKLLRYPEPSYYKILKVLPVQHDGDLENPHENLRKVIVFVASVFRGRMDPDVHETFSTSYKADYHLVPKHEEQDWIRRTEACKRQIKYIDPHIDMPPLLKKVVAREKELSNEPFTPDQFKLTLQIQQSYTNNTMLADEAHPADIKIDSFFGTPLSPELYTISDEVRQYFKEKKPF
uniref:Uncharacterized protein n=1 Tax=Cacopsylla melanoneura TaxID=428564 RepID=A0A8D8TUV7_9HEMI